MFICGKCGRQTRPGEKQVQFTIQTRRKTYHGINKHGEEIIVGNGEEIAKSIPLCEICSDAEGLNNR